jgi:hypothetical protein
MVVFSWSDSDEDVTNTQRNDKAGSDENEGWYPCEELGTHHRRGQKAFDVYWAAFQ